MFRACVIFIFFLWCSTSIFSQSNNNGDTEPTQICEADLNLCVDEMTEIPVIGTPSNLPNLEFIIIDQAVMATNGSGPAIVGIDTDGVFKPSDFGVLPGGSVEVIPISYDLAAIQNTVDDILKGVFIIFFCCDLAAEVCASLVDAGISCGSDVMNLQGVFSLINTSGDLLSIMDFETGVSSANGTLQDPNTPPECGGMDFIAYAYGNSCIYSVYDEFEMILAPNHTISETIERSDFIESEALVLNGLNVNYLAGNYVEMITPFEVQLGGEFLANINLCQ